MFSKKKKQTNSKFNILVWQEEDLFVAKAIELDIVSQGKTPEEAADNLTEAIELYFEDTPVIKSKLPSLISLELTQIFPKLTYA